MFPSMRLTVSVLAFTIGVPTNRNELLNTSTAFGRKMIAPVIPRLLRTHPSLRIDLELSDAVVDITGTGTDMAIRFAMHLAPSSGDNVVPWVLLNKSNIGTPSDSYDVPTDYPSLFEKLWHVG